MADEDEIRVLKLEFEWLLKEHIPKVLAQLERILQDCCELLQTPGKNNSLKTAQGDAKPQDYFMLSTPNSDALKGYVAVDGANISKADLKFKLPKTSVSSGFRVFIRDHLPWKMKQIQDAKNFLQLALDRVEDTKVDSHFSSEREVNKVFDEIVEFLRKGKTRLMVPNKVTILELLNNGCQNVLKPGLPDDVVVNFHINSDKMVVSVFTLAALPVPPQSQKQAASGSSVGHTFEYNSKWMECTGNFEVDCSIPWLSDCLFLFSAALQLCQQLKDKVAVFAALDVS